MPQETTDLIKFFEKITPAEREYLLKKIDPKKAELVKKVLQTQVGATNPVWWIETTFGVKLWEKQREICESVLSNRRTAVASCHGAGKTFISAHLALWFLYTHKNSIVITTAPSQRQVEELLWGEIRNAHKLHKLDGEQLRVQIRLDELWKAFGFSTDDPNAFQGIHGKDVFVILDEAVGVDPNIWKGVQGVLTGENTKLLCLANPTDPSSLFKKECDSPVTNTIFISAYETPNLTYFGITEDTISKYSWGDTKRFEQEKVTERLPYPANTDPVWVHDAFWRFRPGSIDYYARVLGQFPPQSEDSLIPASWIEMAIDRKDVPETLPHEFGIDVAYMGTDKNVVIQRRGGAANIVSTWDGCNLIDSSKRIIDLVMLKRPSLVKIDAIGIGAGIYEMVKDGLSKEAWVDVQPIVGSESASEEAKEVNKKLYLNKRAEMYFELRRRFEFNEISLSSSDTDLISELKDIKYVIASGGQVKIESKDDIRKRLGKSPDHADALAYAFAQDAEFEVPAARLNNKKLYSRSKWHGARIGY